MIEHNPFPETVGGGGTVIRELGKALIKRGHEIHVITSPPEKVNPNYLKDFKYREIFVHRAGIPHKKYKRFISSIPRRLLYEILFILNARKIQKENNFDVVVAQNPLLGALSARKPFFIVMHGVHNQGFAMIRGRVVSFFCKIIEDINVRRAANRIICATKESAKYYNSKIMILNGIDFNRFKPSKKKQNSIVFVGRLVKDKNPDKIVLAMDYLLHYNLSIIGSGPMEKEIRDLCANRKNCKFLGRIDNQDLPLYLKDKQFIAIPSQFDSGPLTFIEGMAAGCTPIITKVGWANEITIHGFNGYLLDNYDPKTIAQTIKIAKPIDSLVLRKSIEKFNLDKIADQYLNIWAKYPNTVKSNIN